MERRPCFGVGREPGAVGPRALRLDRHDLGRRRGEQLAVVADEEHGLAARSQLALEPPLGRDVEEVVGFVEYQHVVLAAEERLERESLLLATAERRERTIRDVPEVGVERSPGALVPEHLGVVAAGVAPLGERRRVAHRIGGGVGVGGVESQRGAADAFRRDRDEQVADGTDGPVRSGGADELAHDAEASFDRHRAGRSAPCRRTRCAAASILPTPLAPTSATRSPLPTDEADVADELDAARAASIRRG